MAVNISFPDGDGVWPVFSSSGPCSSTITFELVRIGGEHRIRIDQHPYFDGASGSLIFKEGDFHRFALMVRNMDAWNQKRMRDDEDAP